MSRPSPNPSVTCSYCRRDLVLTKVPPHGTRFNCPHCQGTITYPPDSDSYDVVPPATPPKTYVRAQPIRLAPAPRLQDQPVETPFWASKYYYGVAGVLSILLVAGTVGAKIKRPATPPPGSIPQHAAVVAPPVAQAKPAAVVAAVPPKAVPPKAAEPPKADPRDKISQLMVDGLRALDRGDTTTALKLGREIVALDGSFAPAYNLKGVAHLRQEETREALENFDKAIQLAPKEAKFYANKALVYESLRDYDQALDILEQALEIEPSNPNWLKQRDALGRKNMEVLVRHSAKEQAPPPAQAPRVEDTIREEYRTFLSRVPQKTQGMSYNEGANLPTECPQKILSERLAHQVPLSPVEQIREIVND